MKITKFLNIDIEPAPPEMELLRLSISNDGYTQPIVSMKTDNENREVIEWECRSSFDMAGIKSGRQILPDEFPGIGEFMI